MSQKGFKFTKATKEKARLRLALLGPSGAGKTWTAIKLLILLLKRILGREPKIAVIDSERGSASKYASLFNFDVLELETYSPETYVQAIEAAEEQGYDGCVIDSLSHAWMGKEGALEQLDKATKRSQSGSSFNAWREVTPMHNALVEAMLSSKMHIIATMRQKTKWVLETNDKGKQAPRRVGMEAVQRDGLEYEFDIVGDMTVDNDLLVSGKCRCPELKGGVFRKPGDEVAKIIAEWLTDGVDAKEKPKDATASLLEDADIKAMFDKLKAPDAKRIATAEKYRDKETLMATLQMHVAEKEKEAEREKERAEKKNGSKTPAPAPAAGDGKSDGKVEAPTDTEKKPAGEQLPS